MSNSDLELLDYQVHASPTVQDPVFGGQFSAILWDNDQLNGFTSI